MVALCVHVDLLNEAPQRLKPKLYTWYLCDDDLFIFDELAEPSPDPPVPLAPWRRMSLTAFWQHRIAPVRLVLHTRTTSLGSMSKSGCREETIPALLSQWWMTPTVAAA